MENHFWYSEKAMGMDAMEEPVEIIMCQCFATITVLFCLGVNTHCCSTFWIDTSAKTSHLTKKIKGLAKDLSSLSSDFWGWFTLGDTSAHGIA